MLLISVSLNYGADLLDVVFCHCPLYILTDGKRPRGRQRLSRVSQAPAGELSGVLLIFSSVLVKKSGE